MTANALRIRDNQRRARARRKEYIQDLEERLRRYERLGTQATIEVQTAARKVMEENALLRSLLKLRGVTDVEIANYVRHDSSGALLSALEACHPSSNAAATQSDPTCLCGSVKGNESLRLKPPNIGISGDGCQEMACDPMAAIKVGSLLNEVHPETISPDGRYSGTHATSQTAPQLAAGPSQIHLPCSHVGNVNTTPCEVAAGIVANVRGHNDTAAARAELGCVSGSSCMVANMTIFRALDK